MFDCKLLVYSSGNVESLRLQDLTCDRRVLICSLTRQISELHHNYLKYITQLKEVYKDCLDDILFVNSFIKSCNNFFYWIIN